MVLTNSNTLRTVIVVIMVNEEQIGMNRGGTISR